MSSAKIKRKFAFIIIAGASRVYIGRLSPSASGSDLLPSEVVSIKTKVIGGKFPQPASSSALAIRQTALVRMFCRATVSKNSFFAHFSEKLLDFPQNDGIVNTILVLR